jgi:CshA-type fibril repeat protein
MNSLGSIHSLIKFGNKLTIPYTAIFKSITSGTVLTDDLTYGGSPITVLTFTIGAVIYNVGQTETVTIPSVGTIVINSSTYSFTPIADYAGSVPIINYTALNVNGENVMGTININVTPVNTAPFASEDISSGIEDTPVSGNVLTNDSDLEGNTLSVTEYTINGANYLVGSMATIPGVGTFVLLANGTYTFTPNANYNGTVPEITYTISDGNGGTDLGKLNIILAAVNDVPSAPFITSITPGYNSAIVNFRQDDNGGTLITNYKYSTDNGITFTPFSPANSNSPLTISGLTNGNSYNIVIKAVNNIGDSDSSNILHVIPN